MAKVPRTFLGLIELADYEHLIDTHGSVSAECLRDEFFSRLRQWVRPGDQTRTLRNNRFLVVLKGVGTRATLELATAKLARLFEPPHDLFGELVPLDVHAGFVLLKGSSVNTKQAMQQARLALRQARKTGVLYQVFNHDKQDHLEDELNLVKALETAVERGELRLYYQPKIHAGYGNLVGAEALMRWYTKDRKIITPSQFIDVAERHPVIRPMTWWAIKAAVARLSKWPEHLSVSVNVTPTLLLDNEILAVVQDVLELHNVSASRLTLEVTENVLIDNQSSVMSQLARLRQLGVRISIDDFGTGYSSLAYFRNLPADELKIDKSFVAPMLRSQKDLTIVKAVIALAHNFSLRVVAEGVESGEIAKRLTELGCDHLQGMAFDAPLPVEDFEKRYLI